MSTKTGRESSRAESTQTGRKPEMLPKVTCVLTQNMYLLSTKHCTTPRQPRNLHSFLHCLDHPAPVVAQRRALNQVQERVRKLHGFLHCLDNLRHLSTHNSGHVKAFVHASVAQLEVRALCRGTETEAPPRSRSTAGIGAA